MSAWTFDYAMNQARLVLRDNGKLHSHEFVENVLTPLVAKLDERQKNPGVWDGAQGDATVAQIAWFSCGFLVGTKDYTRTLPKTKAREIAEAKARIWANGSQSIDCQKNLADIIESAINEALDGGGK